MNILEIKNLQKKFGNKVVVSDISFSIEKGEVFGLLGPNGAGKSTTISMISGLIKQTQGTILINGIDTLKKRRETQKLIGLVPQDIALYPTLSAEENLKFWGKMQGVKTKDIKERVNEVLRIVDLEDRRKERIETYSGGMKRRINIAAAMMHNPEIIIMDEPTVGIDPQSRNHILQMVKELNASGTTIIYTSHYMEEVEFLCNKIGIIDEGKIIAIEDKEQLKKSVQGDDRIEIEVSKINDKIVDQIELVDYITKIEYQNELNKIIFYSSNASDALLDVLKIISQSEIKIIQTKIEEPNLETIFLSLTGKELRD